MLNYLRELKQRRYLAKLKRHGLSLGAGVFLNDGFFLDPAHAFLITIEDRVVFGPRVSVFAHDASSRKVIAKTKIGLVRIGENAFVGANSVILPGTTIGASSIVAAGSVVSGDIPENEVWGGNPAKRLMSVSEYREKLEALGAPEFEDHLFALLEITPERKAKMIALLKQHRFGFMVGR